MADVRSDVTTQSDSATLVEDATVTVAPDSKQAEEGENDVGINDTNYDPSMVTQTGEGVAGAPAGAETNQKDVPDDNDAATYDNEINDGQIQPESTSCTIRKQQISTN